MILPPSSTRGHPAPRVVPTRWRVPGLARHSKDGRSRTQLISLHGREREVVSVSPFVPSLVAYNFASPAASSRGGLAPCRGERREADVRQQSVELSWGHGWQSTHDVLEVCEGIDVVVLTGAGEGVQDG